MEEYDFSVEHRPGIRHANADALSRHPCYVKTCACKNHQPENEFMVKAVSKAEESAEISSSAEPLNNEDTEFWSVNGLRTAQESDPDISFIMNLMGNSAQKPSLDIVSGQSEDVRILWGMWPRLCIWNGILQRRFESINGTSVNWQVVLPKDMRREFLTVVHGGMTGGHLARKKTAASIQTRAYWPTWSTDLDTFLRECQPCARYYRGSAPKKAHLQTPIVGEP